MTAKQEPKEGEFIYMSATTKPYYEEIFSEGTEEHWEKAPGKTVIIKALQHQLDIGKIAEESSVIDVGCGSGFLLGRIQAEVPKNRFELQGLDFSEKAIVKAKRKYPNFHFYCEDGANTHFDSGKFDVVISYGTYEHFPKPQDGVKELARLLRKGGLFFCMMPTLGVDRTDRDDEGWYEERQVPGSPIRQMQWNLKRESWESFFTNAHLQTYPIEESKVFGALKPGVFFFGEKGA